MAKPGSGRLTALSVVLLTLIGSCTDGGSERERGEPDHVEIPVHAYPWAVAEGDGSLWVVHRTVPIVDRIDPGTNEVIDSVELDLNARRPGGLDRIVVWGEHVLITGGGRKGIAYRAPVDDLEALEEISVVGYVNRFLPVVGSLWYTTSGAGRNGPELVRIDPVGLEEIARFDAGGVNAYVDEVLEVDGAIWTLRSHGTPVKGGDRNLLAMTSALWEIDPSTNEVVRRIPLGKKIVTGAADPVAGDLVALDGSLWVTMLHKRSLQEIDPVTGELGREIPLPAFEHPWEAEVLEGSIWVGNLNSAEIARVDPKGPSVDMFVTPPELSEFAAAFGSIWIPVPGPDPWEDDGYVLRLTE